MQFSLEYTEGYRRGEHTSVLQCSVCSCTALHCTALHCTALHLRVFVCSAGTSLARPAPNTHSTQ